ncbi:MAG: iron-sulfur cluster repair di-iron protein [Phaeodactylibacter sp.]|nr:iron-sulfur cluster repair di-iron protein [Phaeodactylibacter sp.]
MIEQKAIQTRTIGELVAEDYRAAGVFKQYGIDFCCGGKRTVAEVCSQKGVPLAELEEKLGRLEERPAAQRLQFNEWALPFLIDYIINIHHTYVQEKLPQLLEYAQKVAKVHGHAYPETVVIAHKLESLAEELFAHLRKEELILFPYVKELWKAKEAGEAVAAPPFQTAQNPIRVMEDEHEFAGSTMAEIRQLSDNFTPPEAACNTYRVLYALLEEFEEDLHQHVHLENNILFPQAVELERSF